MIDNANHNLDYIYTMKKQVDIHFANEAKRKKRRYTYKEKN